MAKHSKHGLGVNTGDKPEWTSAVSTQSYTSGSEERDEIDEHLNHLANSMDDWEQSEHALSEAAAMLSGISGKHIGEERGDKKQIQSLKQGLDDITASINRMNATAREDMADVIEQTQRDNDLLEAINVEPIMEGSKKSQPESEFISGSGTQPQKQMKISRLKPLDDSTSGMEVEKIAELYKVSTHHKPASKLAGDGFETVVMPESEKTGDDFRFMVDKDIVANPVEWKMDESALRAAKAAEEEKAALKAAAEAKAALKEAEEARAAAEAEKAKAEAARAEAEAANILKEIAEQNLQPQSQTSSLGRSTDNAPTNIGGENMHLEPSYSSPEPSASDLEMPAGRTEEPEFTISNDLFDLGIDLSEEVKKEKGSGISADDVQLDTLSINLDETDLSQSELSYNLGLEEPGTNPGREDRSALNPSGLSYNLGLEEPGTNPGREDRSALNPSGLSYNLGLEEPGTNPGREDRSALDLSNLVTAAMNTLESEQNGAVVQETASSPKTGVTSDIPTVSGLEHDLKQRELEKTHRVVEEDRQQSGTGFAYTLNDLQAAATSEVTRQVTAQYVVHRSGEDERAYYRLIFR